eukprot:gene24337-biopygen13440
MGGGVTAPAPARCAEPRPGAAASAATAGGGGSCAMLSADGRWARRGDLPQATEPRADLCAWMFLSVCAGSGSPLRLAKSVLTNMFWKAQQNHIIASRARLGNWRETAEAASGARPGRVRFFKFYRVGRARSRSSLPFLPDEQGPVVSRSGRNHVFF